MDLEQFVTWTFCGTGIGLWAGVLIKTIVIF